jgi:hypothetical protein
MPAPYRVLTRSRALPALGALAVLASVALATHVATAQSATGTVTGRVLWGSCIRGIPLPMTPDGQAEPGTNVSPAPPDGQIVPGSRPQPVNGLPAGAVLVAVQNTPINARTDESGRFTLSGVPAGQYMTVAAGPVGGSTSATAARPNVFVNGGQTVDLGTLSLGGSGVPPFSIACRLPGALDSSGGAASSTATPGDMPNPPADDTPNP